MSEADKRTEVDKRTTVEIELEFPVEFDGQRIESITMRRPKVRDSLKAQKSKGSDMERGIALLSDLCDMAPEQIVELDELDLEKVQAQYLAFTGRSATSEN